MKQIHLKTMMEIFVLCGLAVLIACGQNASKGQLSFKSVQLSDTADLWWARVLADINQDGITDMVLINANGSGGWLGWMEGSLDTSKPWTIHIIADSLEDGRKFARAAGMNGFWI